MKQETKQIPKLFPATYVTSWDGSGSSANSLALPKPSRISVEICGLGGPVTLMGSLDGETWSPIKSKEGDTYRFGSPGIYPVDTSILHVFPVTAEGFNGLVKVMAI